MMRNKSECKITKLFLLSLHFRYSISHSFFLHGMRGFVVQKRVDLLAGMGQKTYICNTLHQFVRGNIKWERK